MIRFALGLIIVASGIGGVENSLDNTGLFAGIAVSVLGLLIMQAGVTAINRKG